MVIESFEATQFFAQRQTTNIYVVYFYYWTLLLQLSSLQIYIILQDITKLITSYILALQYLDNPSKTRCSKRVAFYSAGSFRHATKKAVGANVLKDSLVDRHFIDFQLLFSIWTACVSTKRVDKSKRVVNACKRVETSGKRVKMTGKRMETIENTIETIELLLVP